MSLKSWNDLPSGCRIIPVIVIDNADNAVPLATTLFENGLPVIEITLRTADALRSIEAIATSVPEAIVGAGTILDEGQVASVATAGGQFLVSPGALPGILAGAARSDLPILPGAQTLSEIMALRIGGYDFLKFFPASLLGGHGFLQAVSRIIPDVAFCPTGGVSMENAGEYLDLPNVRAVGGSWIAPRDLIASGDWAMIAERARAAVAASC